MKPQLKTPLNRPAKWVFSSDGQSVSVIETFWFKARDRASLLLGADRESLVLTVSPVGKDSATTVIEGGC